MAEIETPKSFVHLHVHSHYSQLDGMSTIPGLVDKAVKCGMKALALTDHGNMYGIKELYDYVKEKNKELPGDQKIKPILGVEAYCARHSHLDKMTKEDRNGWHLILLAKNKKGYQNLCKLVSKSWIDGYYYKPRIDKELLEKYSEGLIVASACIGGEIPQKLLGGSAKNVDDENGNDTATDFDEWVAISDTNKAAAEEAILWFKNLFGDDYYLELQRHKTDKPGADRKVYKFQESVNQVLLELAKKTNTKVICTNDVHFVEEEHAEAHDRLICLGTGKDLSDPNRMRYTKQEWFKSTEEMQAVFSDIPEALNNTLEIAGKVETYSLDSDALMPAFPIPESFGTEEEYRTKYTEEILREEFNKEDEKRFDKLGGYDKVVRIKYESDYLRELTYKNVPKKYAGENGHIDPSVLERIDFELDTMKTMGFPGYFLIVQDFIWAARDMGVAVGPGRGSAAGSAVAYCLGITDIDPLKYDLLFERFLNPDRISMPDIDIDFDDDGRGDVLRWVTEKYGKEKVAHIVTYGTMATKSSIKDVARVQGLPLDESNRLAKLVPDKFPEDPKTGKAPKVNLTNCFKYVDGLRDARFSSNPELSDILKYAEMLEGTVRQTGVHACGVIIGADDLTNFVPLATAKDKDTSEDLLVTQYEGSVIESVGLIKMDFLGLKTLSIIKEALSNIKKSKGIDVDIDHIPDDDKKTYELYSKGQTVGTFQFESPGMQKYLKELQPSQFEDLIAMNALYRPGPMQYIPSFISRKHGKEEIQYDFPEMEKRLKDTYGITVYQEQVMLLSRDLAGFTRGQSDELRKAMGKKLVDKMAALKEKFLKGAKERGHDETTLEKIWGDWAEFAKYAFNKSHATCYSWVSYQTAYLKAHYPAEFMAANLTRNLDNITEITKFMDECRSMGMKVLGPDVNESDLNFTVNKKGDIRFGLGGVKGVGRGAVEAIVQERETNGPFNGLFDFVERVNLTACNKKNIESLCLSGAFDNFPEATREQMFAENGKGEAFIETLIRYGNKCQTDKNSVSQSLFGGFDAVEIAKPDIPKAEPWGAVERLNKEKELIGIYLSSHPLDDHYMTLNYVCNLQMKDLEAAKTDRINQEIVFGGIVTKYREGEG
ncbi:DNA-directed DNA polymerase [Bacteroidia bacterium]|nr:DNA-directed DNA polymerase [Bacteroidia bacterium]